MAALPKWIEDLEDFSEPINVLCHGDTGSGKNRLWMRLPKIVVLAIEAGAVSGKVAHIPGVKVIRCRTWSDIVRAYEWLVEHPDEFDWVMIDSVTKAQTLCLSHIMKMVVKANPARDPHIPSQGDHFKWQLSMKQLVTDFNDLPTNCIWLARSMVRESPDGDDIIVPSIEGKDYGISAWVCGEMSLVCYLKKMTKKNGDIFRRLYTNEHSMYWCKDWYDVLPHTIDFTNEEGVAEEIVRRIVESGATPQRQAVSTREARPAKKKAKKKG